MDYFDDLSVGHGRFRLENDRAVPLTATVKSAWLEIGEHRQPLPSVTMFNLDKDEPMDPRSFEVAKNATLSFLLGFPSISYEPRFGESIAVGLRLSVNSDELRALSPLRIIRWIPQDQ